MKIILIVFIVSLQGKVLEFSPLGLKQTFSSLKEACKKMGHDSFIVDAVDLRQLNCMGYNINPSDFCKIQRKKNLPPLIRGFVDKKKEQVVCQWGTSAVLSLSCDKKHNRYCKNKDEGCRILKGHYAIGLKTIRSVVFEREKTNTLRCYYQASLESFKTESFQKTNGTPSIKPLFLESVE